jgi:hypothetical protein
MSANDFLSFFRRNRLRFLLLKRFDLNLLSRVEQTLSISRELLFVSRIIGRAPNAAVINSPPSKMGRKCRHRQLELILHAFTPEIALKHLPSRTPEILLVRR